MWLYHACERMRIRSRRGVTDAPSSLLPTARRRLFDHAEAGGDCIGAQCFGPTHVIIASLCAVGVLTALLAARRSARLYLHISYSMRMAR